MDVIYKKKIVGDLSPILVSGWVLNGGMYPVVVIDLWDYDTFHSMTEGEKIRCY